MPCKVKKERDPPPPIKKSNDHVRVANIYINNEKSYTPYFYKNKKWRGSGLVVAMAVTYSLRDLRIEKISFFFYFISEN